MPFVQNPGIRNFMVQQQHVAHGGFANLNSMSAPERRAFTGDRSWPGKGTDALKTADWAREGQAFVQPVHATLQNAARLYKGSDNPASFAAIQQYLEDKGLGDVHVKFHSEQGPSRWERTGSSRYPRPGASTPYVLFSMPGAGGRDHRLAVPKGDSAFVEDRGHNLRVDGDMWGDLQGHADTGRGITKKELVSVLTEHANDGKKGVLSKTERNALLRALDDGLFATRSTADVADKVAKGGALSLLDIQIANG